MLGRKLVVYISDKVVGLESILSIIQIEAEQGNIVSKILEVASVLIWTIAVAALA